LFKQAKDEQKAINDKYDEIKNNLNATIEAEKTVNEVKKKNEELIQKAHGNNNLDAFNACNELLQK
jgi:hypothetical protein